MYQPYPPTGQPTEPPRPPAPVRNAVKLMCASAAVSAVPVIIALAYSGDIKAYGVRWNGHSLTAAQVSHWRPLIITVVIAAGLVVPALWLWMAQANGRGRNWARILSTVLFGLATLQLTSVFRTPIGIAFGMGVLGATLSVLTWLAGLVAIWLLWRPASSAFFKPQDSTPPWSGAELSSRMRSSRTRLPRQL
jgi:hypothetical protein